MDTAVRFAEGEDLLTEDPHLVVASSLSAHHLAQP